MAKNGNAQLKLSLYLALLKMPEEEMTCHDVDLLYLLARDRDIHDAIEQNKSDLGAAVAHLLDTQGVRGSNP